MHPHIKEGTQIKSECLLFYVVESWTDAYLKICIKKFRKECFFKKLKFIFKTDCTVRKKKVCQYGGDVIVSYFAVLSRCVSQKWEKKVRFSAVWPCLLWSCRKAAACYFKEINVFSMSARCIFKLISRQKMKNQVHSDLY